MDFNTYPFDYQECPFRVSSYLEDENVANCTSELRYLYQLRRISQYEIEISELALEYRTLVYYDTRFTTCGFSIFYFRSKLQILFQVYLPAGLLVVVSWTSFLIDPYMVPGRMGLLVTLLLVLVNIFNGFKNSELSKETSISPSNPTQNPKTDLWTMMGTGRARI